ncbi:hypothetical protein [Streptomyces coffeae]|uniref:Uncharacterized protein n=1 Tax=Streptomyces coffeae TaxID=621382 RepID=A0ABS1NQV0_9ACTN|nr:hypothetical protein [Streptomyces coffeae]MBL1102437.1 hypothetical protein [Streptomyces coffeae]
MSRRTGVSRPRLQWHVPVCPERCLTKAHRLREALVRSTIAELGLGGADWT